MSPNLKVKIDREISPTKFEALLDWLSPDRETAGRCYEDVRSGLIRFFRFRGCDDPEYLSDETINRVTAKLATFTFTPGVKIATYFYSFASRIYLEDLARRKKKWASLEPEMLEHRAPDPPDRNDDALDCLDECLSKRDPLERDLMISYYTSEKTEKLRLRKELADKFNVSAPALHTRVHRIRMVLRTCVNDCIARERV